MAFARLDLAESFTSWTLAGLVCLLSVSCQPAPDATRLVLVTIDTLRYDSFASEPTTMPRLAAWARQATVFDSYFSASPSTQPAHASIFTGLHPWQHGVPRNGLRLADHHTTLAERLRQQGFSTTAVVASAPVGRRFGFAQGFDRFDDDFELASLQIPFWHQAAEQALQPGEEPPASGEGFFSLAGRIVDSALTELDGSRAPRQFFWFHFFDPHSPYGDTAGSPEPSYSQRIEQLIAQGDDPWPEIRRARQLYDADVAVLDRALGVLFERLEDEAKDRETHIIVVSDHGESFGEDGALEHGHRLTPEEIHVPCLIRSPRLEPGHRGEPIGSVDLYATLLGLAGLRDTTAGGRDLAQPLSVRPWAAGMRRPFAEPRHERGVDGVERQLPPHWFFWVDDQRRLYRGNSDGVLPSLPDVDLTASLATSLRQLFAGFTNELASGSLEEVADPEARRALEALGYLD